MVEAPTLETRRVFDLRKRDAIRKQILVWREDRWKRES
jgi:hypothetical protein